MRLLSASIDRWIQDIPETLGIPGTRQSFTQRGRDSNGTIISNCGDANPRSDNLLLLPKDPLLELQGDASDFLNPCLDAEQIVHAC